MLWLTVSIAFLKFKKTPQAKLHLLQASCILFVISVRAWLVAIFSHENRIAFQIQGLIFQEIYKVSYELIFQLACLGLRLEKLDDSCCSLVYLLF